MAAARRGAIRRGGENFQDAGAVSVDFGQNRFAGQGERHEDLLAIVHGNAIALRAKTLDEKLHRFGRHARLQAVSTMDGQLRVMREG
jgi:hypothetical protein